MMNMTIWHEILEQIKMISGNIYSSINAPADFSEIQLLERTVGVELPKAFCEYLSTLNGQKNTEESTRNRNAEIPLLGFHPFLSIAGIIENRSMMNNIFATDTEPRKWVTEDKIKPFVWREHWIPFTEFEGCQYLILDCDPGKNGTYGQVFLWHGGMDYTEVIANTFEEFSKGLLYRLSAKKFEITEFGTIEFEDYYIQQNDKFPFIGGGKKPPKCKGILYRLRPDYSFERRKLMELKFEQDEEKDRINRQKHGISFETASYVFRDEYYIEMYDFEHSMEEDRYIAIGMVGDLLFVVFTERGENIRLISARLATESERRLYYDQNFYN